MRVLIVDDSSTMRALIKGMLRRLRVGEIVEARDGPQALAIMGSNRLDLVLLDMQMPTMDGLQCLAALKERPPESQLPPVVMVSGEENPELARQALDLGARAFLPKPFTMEILRQVLSSLGLELTIPNSDQATA